MRGAERFGQGSTDFGLKRFAARGRPRGAQRPPATRVATPASARGAIFGLTRFVEAFRDAADTPLLDRRPSAVIVSDRDRPRTTRGAMNVAEAVGTALVDLGVTDAFGLIGSGNFTVTNAMVGRGARFVAARHECAAVSMADAYARVSGRMGVATVHQGPGLTNATTALTEAAKARTPLVVVAADTSAGAVQSNFRIDQAGLAAAVGAVHERAHSPESALDDLARAWEHAAVERRAVLFSLPLDVQAAEAPGAQVTVPDRPAARAPAPEEARRVADVLAEARAPLILAGRGAVLAGAGPALEALGARTGALLATSANGHGLFAGNAWNLGISGGFAPPTAARLLREADVVLAVGASLNMWTTRHGELIGPDARVASGAPCGPGRRRACPPRKARRCRG